MSRLRRQCSTCHRGPMPMYGGVCINCHHLSYLQSNDCKSSEKQRAIKKFSNEAILDIGQCQLCSADAAVSLYDSACLCIANSRNDDTTSHFIARMFDFTACCHECAARCEGNKWTVSHAASICDVLFSGPRADHYRDLFAMAEDAAIQASETVPMPKATAAAPGTREKIEQLAARAERGESLFSPYDAWGIPGPPADEIERHMREPSTFIVPPGTRWGARRALCLGGRSCD